MVISLLTVLSFIKPDHQGQILSSQMRKLRPEKGSGLRKIVVAAWAGAQDAKMPKMAVARISLFHIRGSIEGKTG